MSMTSLSRLVKKRAVGISSFMRALVDTKPSFPHPNFSDAINRNVVQSEIEGGVDLYDVPPGTVLEVQTRNHLYTIIHKAWGQVVISGHPEFCPDPVEVQIHGSTWGGSMIRNHYLGRAACTSNSDTPCTTSASLHAL